MKLLSLASVLTAVAALSMPPVRPAEAAETAKAMLKDANGQDAGSVLFTQTPRACCYSFRSKARQQATTPSTSMRSASAIRRSSNRPVGTSIRRTRITG